LPLPVTRKARWRPLEAGHVADPGRAPNPRAPRHLLPSRHLDRARIPCGRAVSCVLSTNSLGVFPFLVCATAGGKKSRGGGRVEAGKKEPSTASPPTRRCWGPSVIKWSRTCHRVRRRTFTSGARPEPRRKQSATMYVYPAPPSSLGQRRLHRRPNVSRPAAFPSSCAVPISCIPD
jgi:hypothetical protein